MAQTAIEWFYEQLYGTPRTIWEEELNQIREQANQMFKEQIMDAAKIDLGWQCTTTTKTNKAAEDYYNQTYNKNKEKTFDAFVDPKTKPLFYDLKVNDPMWFPKAKNNQLTEDFIEGYSQAVYQIRLLISSLQEEPTGEIRTYTEFMLKELYNSRDNQNK